MAMPLRSQLLRTDAAERCRLLSAFRGPWISCSVVGIDDGNKIKRQSVSFRLQEASLWLSPGSSSLREADHADDVVSSCLLLHDVKRESSSYKRSLH